MSPKQQVNVRIRDDVRKLLKLLAYLSDTTEAQVIEAAVVDAALLIITALTERWLEDSLPDVWEDYNEKVTLLIKAVERIRQIEIREADGENDDEELDFMYSQPAGAHGEWKRLQPSVTLETIYRSVGWGGATATHEEDE